MSLVLGWHNSEYLNYFLLLLSGCPHTHVQNLAVVLALLKKVRVSTQGNVASFHLGIHCFSDSLGSVLVKEAFAWCTGAGGE